MQRSSLRNAVACTAASPAPADTYLYAYLYDADTASSHNNVESSYVLQY